jgi:hypothetical protein
MQMSTPCSDITDADRAWAGAIGQVTNCDLDPFQQIGTDGRITVRKDGNKGKAVTFGLREMQNLDHNPRDLQQFTRTDLRARRGQHYIEVHSNLVNSRFAYVSVSRASHDAQIYTNDRASLEEQLNHDVSKVSAAVFSKGRSLIAKAALEPTAVFKQMVVSGLRLSS